MSVALLVPRDDPNAALAQPEPGLTPADLLDRAVALRPLLRERQEEHEALGSYGPEIHAAFLNGGFYRITQPRLFGGYEFALPHFFRTMIEVSRGDPGVGWCLTLGASHGWVLASHWPEQAQREIFGPDGLFIAPHRAAPMGTATAVEGGYRIKGRWNYCSGIPHATHLMATAMLRDGTTPERTVVVVIPKRDYTILPDWGGDLILGMRASGSNSVEVADAFLPAHHVVPIETQFARPDGLENGTPGTRLHGNAMYLGRMMGPYHASLVSIVVGSAWAAADEYEHVITTMKSYADPTVLRADNADFQRPLGLALARAEAAQAIVLAGAQRYMDLCARWERDRTPISVEDNVHLWTMIQQGGDMAAGVVEDLFHAAGAFTTKKGNRLQRYFRDVQMYRTHVSAQRAEFGGYLARIHLGRPSGFRGL